MVRQTDSVSGSGGSIQRKLLMRSLHGSGRVPRVAQSRPGFSRHAAVGRMALTKDQSEPTAGSTFCTPSRRSESRSIRRPVHGQADAGAVGGSP